MSAPPSAGPPTSSLTAARIARRVLVGLAVAVAVATVLLAGRVWWSAATDVTGVDFVALYAGAVLARQDGAAVYDLDRLRAVEEDVLAGRQLDEDVLPFPYPPFVAVALAPLAALPFRAAFVVATLLNAACLAGVYVLLVRRLALPARARSWLAVLVGLSLPVWFTFVQGQVSLVALLLLSLLALDLRDDRPARAGAWLALLTFKPQLVPLLIAVLVVRRSWRSLGVACLGAAALWAPSLAWLGRIGAERYVDVIGRMAVAADTLGVHPDRMYNLRALWLWLAPGAEVATAATAVSTLVAAGIVLWSHRDRSPAGFARQWAATSLGLVLVTPHVNVHDVALVVLPCAALLSGRDAGVSAWRLATAAALATAPTVGLLVGVAGGADRPVVPLVLAAALLACPLAVRSARLAAGALAEPGDRAPTG